MNFLEFAVWGAYLTCMGIYLGNIGLGTHIGSFYAMQGIVSIFMPAIMGIIADRWIPAQRLLGICHLFAGLFMFGMAWYSNQAGDNVSFSTLFLLYSLSVAFYMPTLALSNSVAYSSLTQAGLDTVKAFPPIRVFGTVGFICTMWFVDIMVRCEWCLEHCAVLIHLRSTQMCDLFGWTKEESCRGFRAESLHLVQTKEDGYLLHLLHVTRCKPSNHKWFCHTFHRKF